jgi:hypothetical protein
VLSKGLVAWSQQTPPPRLLVLYYGFKNLQNKFEDTQIGLYACKSRKTQPLAMNSQATILTLFWKLSEKNENPAQSIMC